MPLNTVGQAGRPGITTALVPLALLAGPAAAQDWFRAARVVGFEPTVPLADIGYQIGDVDADGDLDQVDLWGNSAVVRLNDGQGDFPATAQTLHGGLVASPSRAALADLDGDGDLDLVARSGDVPGDAGLAVFEWDSIAETYAAPQVVAATQEVHPDFTYLVAADLDGDGDDEIVTALMFNFASWTITAWDWNGAQLMAGPGQTFANTLSTYASPLAVGDLNGDGADDVVALVIDSLQPKAYVFESAAGQLPAPTQLTLGAFASTELHLGDREGDGDLDVLSASAGPFGQGSALQWVRNQGGGSYQLTPATFLPAIDGLAVAVGDWDGDGDADAVGPAGLFENLGDGTFAEAHSNSVASEPLAVADFSGDGRADYFAGGRLFVGDGTFATEDDGYLDFVNAAVDVDRDGDLDLLGPGFGGGTFGLGLEFLPNDAAAGFGGPLAPALPGFGPTESITASVGPADFDGDGRLNLIADVGSTSHPFLPPVFVRRVLLAESGPQTWTEVPSATALEPLPLYSKLDELVDLDGDGNLDLVDSLAGAFQLHTIWWSAGDGAGGVGPPQAVADMLLAGVGDLDGDGLPELLGSASAGGLGWEHFVLRNRGGGTFQSESVLFALSARLIDWDADGDLDLIGRRYLSGAPDEVVGRANQGGVFGPELLLATLGACPGDMFDAGDVDGDGTGDLIVRAFGAVDGMVGVCRGVPASNPPAFEPARCFDMPYVEFAADLDSDGDLDLAGQRLYLGRAVEGATAPLALQYGQGAAGSGGWTPLLGYDGVPQVGETVVTRLVNGPPGALAFYFYGTQEALLPDSPVAGLTVLVGGLFPPITLALSSGGDGDGAFEFPFTVPASFAGFELYKQILLVDPAGPGGLTLSNGLRVRYGA